MKIFNKFQNKALALITRTYEFFFRTPMTPGIYKFIKNWYWSFLGVAIATFLMFLVHILGGRFIGPIEYGKYSLIVSIATFLVLPMILGFSGAIQKYLPQTTKDKKKIISTAYSIILFFGILWLGIYLVFQKLIINLIKIDTSIFLLSLLFAGVFAGYQITEATMLGLLEIKKNSLIRIISFLSLFLIFIYMLFFRKNLNYRTLYISCIIAYSLFSLLVLIHLKKYFFNFNWRWAKILFHFSIYSVFAQVSFIILTNVDKLLINYFLSLKDVGIYQAYISSSQSITLFFTPFLAVYFPTISQIKNKYSIFKRINKIALPVFIAVFFFLIATMFVILKLYGQKYPIYFGLIILFAVSGGLFTIHGLYGFLLGSKDIRSIRLLSGYVFLAMIINFLLNLIFIPLIGLYGAAGATLASYGVLVVLYLSTTGKILKH